MSEQAMNNLARIAADMAMRGAADYIKLNGLKVADYEVATEIIRAEIKLGIDEALADAKKALDANMGRIAESTFRASMLAIGIRAAKQFPVEVYSA